MHGDHTVGGNTKSLTQAESFVSQQCFLDVQITYHFVVLVILVMGILGGGNLCSVVIHVQIVKGMGSPGRGG
jgi:hypothetical protein